MKTVTIEMPNNLFCLSNNTVVSDYGDGMKHGEYKNRTRIIANQFLDYLKNNEEFTDCTFSEDGSTCYLYLKLVRVNKSHCNVLDELQERGVITRYAH